MEPEQIKRQIKCLEFYLKGRIQQLKRLGDGSPKQQDACEMAIAELQLIYDQILPELQKAVK